MGLRGNRVIKVNLDKAKAIAQDMRRAKRDEAFKPLDVQATVPYLAVEAEAKRAVIRQDDAIIQTMIDGAKDIQELSVLVG